jgi:hypothetical protein
MKVQKIIHNSTKPISKIIYIIVGEIFSTKLGERKSLQWFDETKPNDEMRLPFEVF